MPDSCPPAETASEPWAFLSESRVHAAAPPPIPEDTEASDTADYHELSIDVLAGYRRRSKPAREQIKDRLKHGMEVVKKRGAAIKLQHEAKSLQLAIDGQCELLGTLALTHRPPAVDLRAEIAELSHIQDELVRKETTIESLRQTKGGGSAVKDLKHEASQLRNRQQAVMVAVGRKTLAARPEMPGADGAYVAIDRLQSSLDAKQAELKFVQDEIGPLWDAQRGRLAAMKKPGIIVGAVVGALLALYLLWSLLASTLFAAGLPSWVQCYAPSDTQVIVHVDVDKFRKTQLFAKLEGLFPSRSEVKRSDVLQLCADDVRDVFLFIQDDGSPIVTLRTHEDLSLAALVPKGQRDSIPEKYKGFEYIRFHNEYCAKTGACTYCIAPSEEALEETLRRLNRKESPALDGKLQHALEAVAGNDYYVAALPPAFATERSLPAGMPRRLRRLVEKINFATAHLSLGTTIRLQYALAFDSDSDAEDCREVLESNKENVDKLNDALESVPFQVRKPVARLVRRSGEATTIVRKGSLVRSQTDLQMVDVADIIDEFKKLQKGLPTPREKPKFAVPKAIEPSSGFEYK